MSQHLKALAPKHHILDSTIDGMYDHPSGEVSKHSNLQASTSNAKYLEF